MIYYNLHALESLGTRHQQTPPERFRIRLASRRMQTRALTRAPPRERERKHQQVKSQTETHTDRGPDKYTQTDGQPTTHRMTEKQADIKALRSYERKDGHVARTCRLEYAYQKSLEA